MRTSADARRRLQLISHATYSYPRLGAREASFKYHATICTTHAMTIGFSRGSLLADIMQLDFTNCLLPCISIPFYFSRNIFILSDNFLLLCGSFKASFFRNREQVIHILIPGLSSYICLKSLQTK